MTNLQNLVAAGNYEEALESAKEQFPTKLRLINRLTEQFAKYRQYWLDKAISYDTYNEVVSDIVCFQLLDLEQE